jgi:hypothetical protein
MKELEKHLPLTEETRKEQPAPNKKVHYAGKMKVHKGHRVWKLDTETNEITEHKDFGAKLGNDGKVKKTLTRIGDRYLYVLALNKKNARKKFIKKGYRFDNDNNK